MPSQRRCLELPGLDAFCSDKSLLSAQATVAAFAASEGHAHPRVVELPKTEEGLGFNVMGGKEQNSPIYISRIIPGADLFKGSLYDGVLLADSDQG